MDFLFIMRTTSLLLSVVTSLSLAVFIFPSQSAQLQTSSVTQQPHKPVSSTPLIPAYRATYTLLHKSDAVGTAIRELTYLDDNKIKYHYETDISWLIFSDKRSETAIVSIDNNKVTPWQYDYTREGTGRDKSYQWQYNLVDNTATDLKKDKQISLNFTDGLLDKLSYHLQNRLDLITHPEQKQFIYPVISTSGSIKNYQYIHDGTETLTLPFGELKTIRLKREIIEKKRITYAWFAPELNYLLVKLYQIKDGDEQFEAQLLTIKAK